MNEAEAVAAMQPCIAVYAQRIHQRFQASLVSWTVEDLQQEGALAVALACRTFDPRRGVALPTYARARVWGAMWDYVRRVLPGTRQGRVVHVAIEDLPGGIDWVVDTRPSWVAHADARQTLRALRRVPYCACEIELLLRHIGHGEEQAHLARAVGVTTGTMANRLRRCRRRLQAAVMDEEEN